MMDRSTLFRKAALERLASPERLDELMQVTRPMGWLALAAIFVLLGATIVWSMLGSVSDRISGQGVLISRGGVFRVKSLAAGQITAVRVSVADTVEKGQVLALLEEARQTTGQIRSPHAGRVIEVAVREGSVVQLGAPLFTVELAGRKAPDLQAVLYVPAIDGKKIKPGMEVHVTPSVVKREECGVMLGRVQFVAEFPATDDGMMRVLNNENLVREFSRVGIPIQINVDLIPDRAAPSGYRWSSRAGPPMQIRSGTLCTATVLVRKRAPIDLVIPYFRKRLLGVGDEAS